MEDYFLIIEGGFFHLGFAVFQLFFWRVLKWKKDLVSLIIELVSKALGFVLMIMEIKE